MISSHLYANAVRSAIGSDASSDMRQFGELMQEVHAGYFSGGTSRYLPTPNGVNPLGTGSDYHYRTENQYFLMVERARYDDRDNMVIGQGITRFVANVMRTGFRLRPDTGDEQLNADLVAGWNEWANDRSMCDYEGEKTFSKMANSLLRARTVDGDVFVLPTSSGHLQVVENHHCRNPFGATTKVRSGTGIVHGVEILNGRRVGYWFTPDDLEPGARVSRKTRMRRIAARDRNGNRQVLQIYDPKRFSQRRGVTALAPVVFTSKYHDDLQFANLVNAKRQSFIATIHTFDTDAGTYAQQAAKNISTIGKRSELTRADGTTNTVEGSGPGVRYTGKPGEKITPWAPNVPAASFFDHANMLLLIISINLDMPDIVFRLDASSTNFNGYRGVIDQARQRFEQIQAEMVEQFHAEVYRWWLRRQIASDPAIRSVASRSDVNVFGHRWTPQGWPYVQPVQDATTDILRLNGNLVSHQRRSEERGMVWEDELKEIVQGRAMLIEHAITKAEEINAKFPELDQRVMWRELAYGFESNVKVSMTGQIDGAEMNQPTEASGAKD